MAAASADKRAKIQAQLARLEKNLAYVEEQRVRATHGEGAGRWSGREGGCGCLGGTGGQEEEEEEISGLSKACGYAMLSFVCRHHHIMMHVLGCLAACTRPGALER